MRTRGSRSAMKGESFATSVFDRLGQIRQADVANSKGFGSVLSLAREAQLASNERRSKICRSRPFPRTIHTCMCHPTATRIDHRDVCMDTHFDRLAFSVRISLSRRRLGPAAPGAYSDDGDRHFRFHVTGQERVEVLGRDDNSVGHDRGLVGTSFLEFGTTERLTFQI
jgi:hypothetical protein